MYVYVVVPACKQRAGRYQRTLRLNVKTPAQYSTGTSAAVAAAAQDQRTSRTVGYFFLGRLLRSLFQLAARPG